MSLSTVLMTPAPAPASATSSPSPPATAPAPPIASPSIVGVRVTRLWSPLPVLVRVIGVGFDWSASALEAASSIVLSSTLMTK